jgi:hypothetical protein
MCESLNRRDAYYKIGRRINSGNDIIIIIIIDLNNIIISSAVKNTKVRRIYKIIFPRCIVEMRNAILLHGKNLNFKRLRAKCSKSSI